MIPQLLVGVGILVCGFVLGRFYMIWHLACHPDIVKNMYKYLIEQEKKVK